MNTPEVLAAGGSVPVFNWHVTPDQKVTLGELREKRAVLALLPADWRSVCGEILLHNESLPKFTKHEAGGTPLS
jgi:peroxiredoxin